MPVARLRRWARTLKRDIIALYLATRDPRVPWYAKAAATDYRAILARHAAYLRLLRWENFAAGGSIPAGSIWCGS